MQARPRVVRRSLYVGVSVVERRLYQAGNEPKLDVEAIDILEVVTLEVVAVDDAVAHQRLCLGQPRDVVIQTQNLTLREDGKNLPLAELDGVGGVVRQSRVGFVHLFDNADNGVVHLLEQDVDSLDQGVARVHGDTARLHGVLHTNVEVLLFTERKGLALEDGGAELRGGGVLVVVVLPPISEAQEPVLHKVLTRVYLHGLNVRCLSGRGLDNQYVLLQKRVVDESHGLRVRLADIDSAGRVRIVGEEQQVVNQVYTSDEVLRVEAEGRGADHVVGEQLAARIERDDEVQYARVGAVYKRRVMHEPVYGLVGSIGIRSDARGGGTQGRARRWVYQRRKLLVALGVLYSTNLGVLGAAHADVLCMDVLSVGNKALVNALVHPALDEVPYQICHYLIHLPRPRRFISNRPGWMLLMRILALRNKAFFFFRARFTMYSCTPNLASRIA